MKLNPDFQFLLNPILESDALKHMKDQLETYAYLIIPYDIKQTKERITQPYNIEEEEITDENNNNNIMFKYIEYELNEEAKTFTDLFTKSLNKPMTTPIVAF